MADSREITTSPSLAHWLSFIWDCRWVFFHFRFVKTGLRPPVESRRRNIMTEENNYYTDERIRSDLDYQRAQRTARCMLDTGLISDDEFNKLCDINRKTFSPLFAEIYPKTACYVSEKE